MSRAPTYTHRASEALDQLESGSDAGLREAVYAVIDLICDYGDTAAARRQLLRVGDHSVRRVAVRGSDWVVLWWPVEQEARIYYIGARA